ncbi:ribonuclease H-like domain-containing protein [Tanacetum coccineum]|uniref:Ribonuclease H-like domain-containing protein n=1 Tax=Tanacetum coccineum TaxID=301880 RepID=A0ABQ5H296_9ASTR
MKVEESLNVTFDETPPPPKTSPLEDDDLVKEEAIEVNKTRPLGNDLEDKSLENNEILNIKESKSHPLETIIETMTGDASNSNPSKATEINFGITNIKSYIPIILDLDELNYDQWSELFTIHCKTFGVYEYLTGTTTSTDPTDEEWEKRDNLVKLWIYGTISKALVKRVLKKNLKACDVWKNLKDVFHDNKDVRAMQLDNVFHDNKDARTCSIEFDEFGFSMKDYWTRQLLIRCDSTGDLYPFCPTTTQPTALIFVSPSTWHQRLGHPGNEVLCFLVSNNYISCNNSKSMTLCHACQLGKHVCLPFSLSDTIIESCFDIIHLDVWTSPETDIQEKEQKESQKQTNPSTRWKGQSQKSSQMKKIQLEGL